MVEPAEENLRLGQLVQELALEEGEKVLTGHWVQTPLWRYEPAGQDEHDDEPGKEYWPLGQLLHESDAWLE